MSDVAALFTWANMWFLLQGLGLDPGHFCAGHRLLVRLGHRRLGNAHLAFARGAGAGNGLHRGVKNTPLLLWIMFTFFVAQLPPMGAAVLAFTLFTSASVAEIVRGGLASVPSGSTRPPARRASPVVQVYALVILPQALRNMVPALLSQFVTTIKDTSYLWGAMALQELMGAG